MYCFIYLSIYPFIYAQKKQNAKLFCVGKLLLWLGVFFSILGGFPAMSAFTNDCLNCQTVQSSSAFVNAS